MTLPSANEPAPIRIEGELTIYRAAELKPVLLAPLAGGDGAIEIDLSAVTEIDTAGVQLLMLLHREATAAGRLLRLRGASAAVQEAVELLDLAPTFGDSLVAA